VAERFRSGIMGYGISRFPFYSKDVEEDMKVSGVKSMKAMLAKSFYMFVRDGKATLMMFVSPLAFMLILGFVIAGISGGTQNVSVKLAFHLSKELQPFQKALLEEAKSGGFDVTFVEDDKTIEKLVSSAKMQMGISLTSTSMTFFYNQAFGQYNNYLRILQEFVSQAVRKKLSGIPTYVEAKPVEMRNGVNLTVISFIVPGAMAIAILTACVLSTATAFSNYRSSDVLKRLKVTPLSGNTFAFSIAIHRFWSSVASSILTVLAAEAIFSTIYDINWLLFLLMLSTAALMSIGLGTIFSVVFRDMWTTINFSTILLTVMMLFSNVFYPFSIMPNYMRVIAHAMPVTYFTQGLRYALGISPMYMSQFLIVNAVFALLGISLIILGGRIMFYFERR
jgi:ABC-2 type transport system permease protein